MNRTEESHNEPPPPGRLTVAERERGRRWIALLRAELQHRVASGAGTIGTPG